MYTPTKAQNDLSWFINIGGKVAADLFKTEIYPNPLTTRRDPWTTFMAFLKRPRKSHFWPANSTNLKVAQRLDYVRSHFTSTANTPSANVSGLLTKLAHDATKVFP